MVPKILANVLKPNLTYWLWFQFAMTPLSLNRNITLMVITE